MLDKFKLHLKAAHQSLTAPRLAVFTFLQDHDPTTIEAVLTHHAGAIDRASVYRTLSLFRQLGVIQDIVSGGQRMIELTDTFDSHHHHLSCLRCGTILPIDDPTLEQHLDQLAARLGFLPQSHQIEVSGLCATCQQGTATIA